MADRIRGITIEIDGDTKGLSQALKGVNKDIKTTQIYAKVLDKNKQKAVSLIPSLDD